MGQTNNPKLDKALEEAQKARDKWQEADKHAADTEGATWDPSGQGRDDRQKADEAYKKYEEALQKVSDAKHGK